MRLLLHMMLLPLITTGAFAATLELKNGKTLRGDIVHVYLDYVYLKVGTKAGDFRTVYQSDINAIKEASDAEQQLLTFSKPEVAEFPSGSEAYTPRTLTTAQLQAWYGDNLALQNDDALAQKVLKAEALFANFLAAPEQAKATALLPEILALKLPEPVLRAVVRHGRVPVSAAPKTGEFDTIAPVAGYKDRRMQLALRVPENYSHDKAWPLIVSLHGTNGHCNYIAVWQRESTEDFIVVAPWADAAHGWGPSTYGRAQVLQAIEWVATHYRIDRRRIFLDGFSMGGIGVKRLASFMPDRFAGICCRSGPPLQKNLSRMYRNLHHTPFLSFSGEKDQLNPLSIIQEEQTLIESLKMPAKVYIFPDRDHDAFTDRNVEVLDLFDRCERENMPDTLRFSSYEDGPGLQHYYLEITAADHSQNATVVSHIMNVLWITKYANADLVMQRDTRAMVEYAQREKLEGSTVEKRTTWQQPREIDLKVDREKNTITIERAALVKAVRIYVDDDLLDLSREIEVLYLGKSVLKKTIPRAPAFMLNHARKTNRRDITYWGALDVRLDR